MQLGQAGIPLFCRHGTRLSKVLAVRLPAPLEPKRGVSNLFLCRARLGQCRVEFEERTVWNHLSPFPSCFPWHSPKLVDLLELTSSPTQGEVF